MKKQKKRILRGIGGIGAALCMSAAICMTGYAGEAKAESIEAPPLAVDYEGSEIMPMTIDAGKTVSFNVTSGTAAASVRVKGMSGEVTKISITMYLQKKSANGSYAAVKTWSGSVKGNYYNFKRTCKVAKGTYRVKAKITCYKGSKSETTTKYSSAKIYR